MAQGVAPVLNIEIDVSQIRGAEEALRRFPLRLKEHMRTAMKFSLEEVLKRALDLVPWKTGTLRRSINMSKPMEVGTGFDGVVGTGGLPYARIIEYGFSGPQNVRAFIRSGAFGRPTAPYTVPSHTRQVNRAAQPYMRPALAASADAIQGFHAQAVEDTASEMSGS